MLETISSNDFVQNNLVVLESDNPPLVKKKRNLPGNPDPEAEVIALSPKTLMATNRFLCEICGKGFQRDQNLQLHRRGHNLPWKLKQRTSKEIRKRVYVCPEKTCVHHHPSRALGDLTGIKKHFCRKHGEKKWKCEKCSKRYAVQSDWKAHSKTCGTREYKCDCGTLFSRRDSFITHRAFCDALAEETARINAASNLNGLANINNTFNYHLMGAPNMAQHFSSIFKPIISTNPNDQPMDQTRKGLSFWLNQPHEPITQETHYQFGLTGSSGSIFHHEPLNNISCSNPPPSSDYHQNWPIFGGNNTKNNQQVSVPSLYSTQQPSSSQSHQTCIMSATALLQKAAQIGATSTDPSFLESFGLKSSSNIQIQDQENNNKFCGLMYGLNSTSFASDHHHHVEKNNGLSSLNQLEMYSSSESAAKRQKVVHDHQDCSAAGGGGGGGGQTRDFLGVGVQQAISHQSSINGWI
ncbi:zinc finger protein NUTCRACKER [Mercurialis annua]|uniref:zinc finger protein NUTCRACKER n=1 Tax=Mercurialis annua TaxID=3986 RepID=UPI002160C42B|nr:zinc finger protein NUTCRACKER [Mercurialis annua]